MTVDTYWTRVLEAVAQMRDMDLSVDEIVALRDKYADRSTDARDVLYAATVVLLEDM